MFNTIFNSTATGLDIGTMLICAGVGIALGIIIALVHKFTSRCSKDFLITLATLPVLVSVVMIMINGSLGTSIAILGSFSLIRFRSMPGSAKELLSVFFAMAIGLALGMGHVFFAVVFTVIVSVMILIYSKVSLFNGGKAEQILKVTIPEDLDYTSAFDDEFKKFTTSHRLLKTKTINMGSLYKISYYVALKNNVNEKEFLDAIRVKNCNLQVLLSTGDDEKEM